MRGRALQRMSTTGSSPRVETYTSKKKQPQVRHLLSPRYKLEPCAGILRIGSSVLHAQCSDSYCVGMTGTWTVVSHTRLLSQSLLYTSSGLEKLLTLVMLEVDLPLQPLASGVYASRLDRPDSSQEDTDSMERVTRSMSRFRPRVWVIFNSNTFSDYQIGPMTVGPWVRARQGTR